MKEMCHRTVVVNLLNFQVGLELTLKVDWNKEFYANEFILFYFIDFGELLFWLNGL